MILIAHRGNVHGRRPRLENTPAYLHTAAAGGYDVEVDVWFKDGEFFLGHDGPQAPTTLKFLSHPRFWLHAKNIDALLRLRNANLHCFFHDNDAATLTSRGYIWTFPGQPLTELSICVLPERPDGLYGPCAGVCSDLVGRYREIAFGEIGRAVLSGSIEVEHPAALPR